MKAVQITSYEGPGTLEYGDAPEPTPAAGQVSLDVRFAGANYVEALFSEGLVPDLPVPWVPGIEASGKVRALGEGAEGLTVGQDVAALTINGGGAYGQVAVTNVHLVAPLPEGLSISEAAAVPSNTTTALIALELVARLTEGESVLVQAAAGGLGSQFGQVAKHLGAGRVVGVVGSEEKRQAALDLGYDEVWLRKDLAEQSADQFDVIADPVSGPARSTCIDLLRLGGRLLAVGDAAQAGDQQISSNALWFGGKGVIGFNLGAFAATKPAVVGDFFRRALDLVANGAVKVHVADTVPIQSAPAVLTELRGGRTVGKTVFQHEF
ncbi:zinc-binding dehydrogenase [Microbacterium sp. 2C]|uniref:quinone oxidoreductase family protein n=1 Tax=Microbacterium paulum TaxID=2707006 RepID=UPI0018C34C00|nr:zinc-binding dehydrogenase [Microbacterium paulum]MBG0716547.1 zinc-binding dehydrogenase [Microbacterium paulum]